MNSLVIGLIIKASILLAAAGIANALLRHRTSAASRHLIWTLALTFVLLLPVLSAVVPTWGIPIHVGVVSAPSTVAPVASNEGWDRQPATIEETRFAAALPAPVSSNIAENDGGGASSTSAAGPERTSPANLLLALYLAGVGVLALRLAFGRLALRRLVQNSSEVTDLAWHDLLRECELRMGVSKPVRLLRSLDRSMPMAFGLRTPTILLPAIADTWSEDRRRAVLLHEVAHIDRRDCLTQLLAEVACAAWWMHPAVWWVASRLRVERELACDDRVIAAGTVARDYAAHLLEIAYSLGGFRSPALVVSMARSGQLEGRLLAVLDAARNRVALPLRTRVVGLLAAAALVLPLAAAEAVVAPDTSTEPLMRVSQATAPTAPERPTFPESTSWTNRVEAQSAAPIAPASPVTRPAPAPGPAPAAPVGWTENDRDIQLPGTWEVRPTKEETGMAYLRISDRPNSTHGSMIGLNELDGLSPALLSGASGPARFNLRRDAGTLVFDGVFRSGIGAGTFDFTPSQTFGPEMAKRGYAAPTTTEQYRLARGNIGFAYLDELTAQKYERPGLDELLRASNHGVNLDYLRGMGSAGFHLGRIEALIRTRDHGVTPRYAREMAVEGQKNLSAEQLVKARDHGVTPDYIKAMRDFGYGDLALDELIRARDHGVTADYLRSMAALGHERMALAEVVRARDHGVSADYVKAMRETGYGALSLDELIKARDHGVSADFIRSMAELGSGQPPLAEVVKARDHGVGPEFIKAWRDLGYQPDLAEMIRARDHGVTPGFVNSLKSLGYEQLTVSELVRLRDHGISSNFVSEQNAGAGSRLSVDELVRRRNGRW